jgi:glycosyltransferase involved in cell wall biosynthesis
LAPLAPYKNQFSLVKAIPSIIHRHPETRFVFVGETPIRDYYTQILQYIQDNSLGKYVLFTGFIKNYADLPKYYNLADVYVLLSHAEGNMPKTTLEAMACGKAIVVSDIPQNREGTFNGDEMLLVNPDNIDAISNAISNLLEDPHLRHQLGENAIRTVDEYYTPEVVAKRMVQIYERIRNEV